MKETFKDGTIFLYIAFTFILILTSIMCYKIN